MITWTVNVMTTGMRGERGGGFNLYNPYAEPNGEPSIFCGRFSETDFWKGGAVMDRGRRRKPTELLRLAGSKHARGREDMPSKILTEIPESPEYLSDAACEKWRNLCEQLVPLGVLAATDLDMLAQLAVALAQWDEFYAMVCREGIIVNGRLGTKMNPAYIAQERAATRIDRLQGYFGLSPAMRSKVRGTPPRTIGDKSRFFRLKP